MAHGNVHAPSSSSVAHKSSSKNKGLACMVTDSTGPKSGVQYQSAIITNYSIIEHLKSKHVLENHLFFLWQNEWWIF